MLGKHLLKLNGLTQNCKNTIANKIGADNSTPKHYKVGNILYSLRIAVSRNVSCGPELKLSIMKIMSSNQHSKSKQRRRKG